MFVMLMFTIVNCNVSMEMETLQFSDYMDKLMRK